MHENQNLFVALREGFPAELVREMREASRARPVQVPDGRELLAAGDDLVGPHRFQRHTHRVED